MGSYLVIGAHGGIGQAVVKKLESRGDSVIGWDAQAGDNTSEVDITDPESVRVHAAKITDALDAVINAVGFQNAGPFDEKPLKDHLLTVDVNLKGFIICAYLLHNKIKQDGTMCMIGSISSSYGSPEFAAYAATKAGVSSLAETLDLEWDHIKVQVVLPLFVDTPMTRTNNYPYLVQNIGIVHTAEEVADVVVKNLHKNKVKIFISWRPRMIWMLSRQFSFLARPLMRLSWEDKRVTKIWRRKGAPGTK